MKIKDFMITDVISVTESTSVKELLEILVSNKIGGVPIANDEGKLLGVISDGDVIRYLQPKGRTVYDMFSLVLVSEQEGLEERLTYSLDFPVSKMMRTKEIYTLKPNQELEDALTIFSKHPFKKLPVVNDQQKVIGVISRGDVLRFIYNRIIEK
ncbi:CBS domain-containing protein [Oceanobacillus limi]|uniref:CBS domain-containing protein n=1 Tax=Oceanobacillus limi TaxID=930131 RepID=A0A1H9Z9Z4_9BACI|nr:CBS domain-containing protein [Oceanobacillus limi]SES78363.1 CBS domain-containing protein [Oceanobacillus limi]